jgi:Uma2 family endonuclease
MSTGVKDRPNIRTLADLLDQLGGVPLDRVRFHPLPGTATVEDVLEIEARENRLCEFVDGVLVEKPLGYAESRIAILLATALQNYLAHHDLGVITGESGMFRMLENLVRIPDVAFAGWDQFPNRELPEEGAPEIVPELAAEVLSKSNTAAEMSRKLREYFRAGSRLVWLIDPQTKTVAVYTSPTRSKVLTSNDSLDGGKVLPGFAMPVASLFANLGKSPKRRK